MAADAYGGTDTWEEEQMKINDEEYCRRLSLMILKESGYRIIRLSHQRNIRDGKFWIRELSGLQWKVWRNLEAFDSEEEQKRRAIELITGKKYLLV